MTLIKRMTCLLLLCCLCVACESFLDEKPDRELAIPTTLADLQDLLDNASIINDSDPAAGEISADDYYLTEADWAGLRQEEARRLYTWETRGVFPPGSNNDWSLSYRPVFTANTVLEQLPLLGRTARNQAAWDNVKGQALFVRAKSFLQVASLWAPAYQQATAGATPGIPLRLNSDFNEKSRRATLQETYTRIIQDLQQAVSLLPATQVHPVRPSRAAAHALLARAYLYTGQYPKAEQQASQALALHQSLLNFNDLNPATSFPIRPDNPEIIYRSIIRVPEALEAGRARVSPDLYQSYEPDDLRREIYFRSNGQGTYGFRGSHEGNGNLFSGITTGEVYLVRAEARARQGKTGPALEDLNTLLVTRWRTGTFVPLMADNPTEALAMILQERRKELLMRGLRWMDIKRLNRDGADIIPTRVLNGQTLTLPPHDPRYVLPLPEDVLILSGM